MNGSPKWRNLGLCLFLVLGATAGCTKPQTATAPVATATAPAAPATAPTGQRANHCPTGRAVATDGLRRLAVVVGVGDYANPAVRDLVGPANDARRVFDLLTDPVSGYGFAKANVCLLLDGEATTQAFLDAVEQGLVARAQEDDIAVIYFAGHGSRVDDDNGDEADDWDETLLFHDARFGTVTDLIDDEFNSLLARLHAKTNRLTVILDSCNSASATRDGNTFAVRMQPPSSEPRNGAPRGQVHSDGDDAGAGADAEDSAGWLADELPGLVSLSAASDNTPALETRGSGVFTDALLQVLYAQGQKPMTWAQVARRIRPLIAARSYQIPYAQGDLSAIVFANEDRARPVAWEVTGVEGTLELSGPPLPGMGPGAELRIYDGSARRGETQDPARSKATIVIAQDSSQNSYKGTSAKARVIASRPDAEEIRPGDLAVLVRPSDAFTQLRVRLRSSTETGGLPAPLAAAIESAVADHPEAALLISLTRQDGDFELRQDSGQLSLWGPSRRRETFTEAGTRRLARNVAASLWRHARQKALLALQGEGGGDFEDQHTLDVELVPADAQTACAHSPWLPAAAHQEQVIPLCHRWHIQVKLREDAPMPLLVGGLVLSTDGAILAFPKSRRTTAAATPEWYVKLEPGDQHVFSTLVLEGRPPLDVQDKLLVFGTQESNPVPWHLLAESAGTRSAVNGPSSPLFRALDRYLQPGVRGQTVADDTEDTTWTLTSKTMRVEANRPLTTAETSEALCDERQCGQDVKMP